MHCYGQERAHEGTRKGQRSENRKAKGLIEDIECEGVDGKKNYYCDREEGAMTSAKTCAQTSPQVIQKNTTMDDDRRPTEILEDQQCSNTPHCVNLKPYLGAQSNGISKSHRPFVISKMNVDDGEHFFICACATAVHVDCNNPVPQRR